MMNYMVIDNKLDPENNGFCNSRHFAILHFLYHKLSQSVKKELSRYNKIKVAKTLCQFIYNCETKTDYPFKS